MGVGISDWRLARAVSSRGHLGVVSGTGIDTVFVRRLQTGDLAGDVRRAMAHFPIPGVVDEALERFFVAGGKPPRTPFKLLQMYSQRVPMFRRLITMLAAFVEVFLAKEGHGRPVGMNLLTKVMMPNLDNLYGAMLAGVDFILMGAGIPREVPGALDSLADGRPASFRMEVENLPSGAEELMTLDPKDAWGREAPKLKRPNFLAIISSNLLATMLAKKASGRVDGFIIEGPTAGGHNAPPREPKFNDRGEPVYGARDVVDLAKMRDLGLPFWLAGGSGRRGALAEALASGASGIQVGTLFAYCDESGMGREYKESILADAREGKVDVFTDPRASPTGFPFKVVNWPHNPADHDARPRLCDLGYLRAAYRSDDGRIEYRCASEPVDAYVKKGGKIDETEGRKCLCNMLMADIGIGQVRTDGYAEPPLITSGDDVANIGQFLNGRERYTADDVLTYLTADAEPAAG